MVKILCDFWQLSRVTRNKGEDVVTTGPSSERHLRVIYLTLMTLNPTSAG
jgi:hypothetical protein